MVITYLGPTASGTVSLMGFHALFIVLIFWLSQSPVEVKKLRTTWLASKILVILENIVENGTMKKVPMFQGPYVSKFQGPILPNL